MVNTAVFVSSSDTAGISLVSVAAMVNVPEGVANHELRFERIGDHMLVYTLSKPE